MKIIKYHDLEIEPEAHYISQPFFYFQKMGLTLLSIFIMAALFGFFGHGIFSQQSLEQSGTKVSFEKFVHMQATTLFDIEMTGEKLCASSKVEIWFSTHFFKNASLKSISPTPSQEMISDDKIFYQFNCARTTTKVHVVLSLEPEKFGHRSIQIGTGNGANIHLNQYIYP